MVNYMTVDVEVLKEFLVRKGANEQEIKNLSRKNLVAALVDNELENEFDIFYEQYADNEDESTDFSSIPLEEEVTTLTKKPTKNTKSVAPPKKGDPKWNEYVLSHFTDEEKVEYTTPEGKKINAVKADGLRRVASLLLGPVTASGPIADHINYNGYKGLPEAWVKYRVIIEIDGKLREFSALADVSYLNTEDAFLGFALQTAETKAKGRAYKEALGVQTYAIEEFSGKKNTTEIINKIVETNADWTEDKPITAGQKRSINNMCEKLGISVFRFINSKGGSEMEPKEVDDKPAKILEFFQNEKRYTGLDDDKLTSKKALVMIGILNHFQQNVRTIHDSLRDTN